MVKFKSRSTKSSFALTESNFKERSSDKDKKSKRQDGIELSKEILGTWMAKEVDILYKQVRGITSEEVKKMESFIKQYLPKNWKPFGGESFIGEWNYFPQEVEENYQEDYATQNEILSKYPEIDLYLNLWYALFLRKYALLPKGSFTIYRFIDKEALDPDAPFELQWQHLGVHWTMDESVARARGQIIFKASVSKNDVDWRKTLFTNTYYPPEKEIWLKENIKIYLESYENLDEEKVYSIGKRYSTD